MYIAEIDDILDQTLDKYMYTWIIESKFKELINIETIINEPNFVKFQKDINKTLDYSFSIISQEDIQKIVTKNSNIELINNLIKKYISYYFFIIIGINYKSKIELFNNNLVEFGRNQINYPLKIDNFFNAESNSNIIKSIQLIKELLDFLNKIILINKKENKKENPKEDNDKYINLLKNYSIELNDFIQKYSFENLDGLITLYEKSLIDIKDKKAKYIFNHNIVKIIIYLKLYKSEEKKEIFNIIETSEISTGEYIFIDVVVPQSLFIDYNAIESILHPNEIKTNLPETIYNLINEDYAENLNDKRKYFTNLDFKIQKLLDTHIIIPIVDDFLLYHKDNEKYEKQGDKLESPKKKEETKIKYIINKINTVSELYRNPTEIKKLFYVPLQNRNAILVNNYEDVKIISKMANIIKMNVENLDLLNDLINFRMYPYISYRDFEKNGFIFNNSNTNSAIRKVNFNNIKKNKLEKLQTRIVSEDMTANIVGFAIINNYNELECLNLKDFININETSINPVTTITTLLENKIKSTILKQDANITTKNNYYWLFDLEKNKYFIPNYDISESMPKNEIVKIVTAYLYDFTLETIINIIKNNIDKEPPKYIYDYINNIDKIKNKFPDIYNQAYSHEMNELEYLIYYVKCIKNTDLYDQNEDEFPGLYGKIYKLPEAPKKKKAIIPTINFTPDFKDVKKEKEVFVLKSKDIEITQDDYNVNEYITAICQHNISWDRISDIKKEDELLFSKLIYSFMQQYIEITATQDYICKSCKSPIDIKKFINDGLYDDNTQSFVTFSVHMDVNIEDLPEYDKFKTSIRNLEKIIEKISSILNIHGLTGNSYNVRSKRKTVVKDSIDIILNHNSFLKNNYLSNRDKSLVAYGLNKTLSNLFYFELDNSIFVYSSKDKDYYKIIKYNNVIGYVIILLILELNESQIISLNNDKLCSYYIFKKIGFSLFEGVNIVINKSLDLKPIKNYPILCYLIYLFSCFITKYNIWANTLSKENTDTKKFNPLIQKSVIHTVIELLNTILNVDLNYSKKNKIYLYEILLTKYYLKLELFKDRNLTRKLDQMYISETVNKDIKKNIVDTTKYDLEPNYLITNDYLVDDLYQTISLKYCLKRFYCPYKNINLPKLLNSNNLTNCIEGIFHTFSTKGTKLICNNCKVEANMNYVKDSDKFIHNEQINNYYKKLAKKYCLNGQVHQFEYNSKNDANICKNCNYKYGNIITYNIKDLEKMYNIIEKIKKDNNLLVENMIKKMVINNENEEKSIKKIFDKLVYKFQKNDNDINNSINILLDNIQKLLGTDILIDNNVHNLTNNIYIIDHDFNGNKLDTKIQIYDKDNKFRIIDNHPFFKRDVIVYSIQKNTKYEVFYDLHKKYLLGYREVNKEYNLVEKPTCKIITNYSIKNLLLLFGFTRQYIDIRDFFPEIIGYTQEKIKELNNEKKNNKNSEFNMNSFANKVCDRRLLMLKKLGCEMNRFVNRINFKYKVYLQNNPETQSDLNQYQLADFEIMNNPLDIIYSKFTKKFDSNITILSKDDKNNKHVFLKYINTINIYLPFNKIKEEPKFSFYVDFNYFIKNDFNGNMILNYIIDEFNRLLNYNQNKTTKTNICMFILEIINKLFNIYNLDVATFDKDVDHFNQILYTSEFYLETQFNTLMVDAIDYYGNQHNLEDIVDEEQKAKILDELEDDNEEQSALDLGDEELDFEGRYDLYSNYDFQDIEKVFDRNYAFE